MTGRFRDRRLPTRAAPAVFALASACAAGESPLRIDTCTASATSARLNAHLIQSRRDAILVKATMTEPDARAVAERIDRSGTTLRAVFITSSQPDRYLGLSMRTERLSEARVLATPEVAADIAARGPGYLERLRRRWGDRIPETVVVPEPFAGDELALEGHAIHIHRFRGGGCPRGAASGLAVIDAMSRYLDDFGQAVALGSRESAAAHMVERSPDYALERLLREYSLPVHLDRSPPDASGEPVRRTRLRRRHGRGSVHVYKRRVARVNRGDRSSGGSRSSPGRRGGGFSLAANQNASRGGQWCPAQKFAY